MCDTLIVSKIEGLGLYDVYITCRYHVVRIKKNINILHNRIEMIEVKLQ